MTNSIHFTIFENLYETSGITLIDLNMGQFFDDELWGLIFTLLEDQFDAQIKYH